MTKFSDIADPKVLEGKIDLTFQKGDAIPNIQPKNWIGYYDRFPLYNREFHLGIVVRWWEEKEGWKFEGVRLYFYQNDDLTPAEIDSGIVPENLLFTWLAQGSRMETLEQLNAFVATLPPRIVHDKSATPLKIEL